MEHRWGNRKPLDRADVEVRKEGRALGHARGIDINLGGIGLECDLALHAGEVVEVQLPKWESAIRSLVVHAGKKRCGLMFLSVPEGFRHRDEGKKVGDDE